MKRLEKWRISGISGDHLYFCFLHNSWGFLFLITLSNFSWLLCTTVVEPMSSFSASYFRPLFTFVFINPTVFWTISCYNLSEKTTFFLVWGGVSHVLILHLAFFFFFKVTDKWVNVWSWTKFRDSVRLGVSPSDSNNVGVLWLSSGMIVSPGAEQRLTWSWLSVRMKVKVVPESFWPLGF